jgi:hypothetical protein
VPIDILYFLLKEEKRLDIISKIAYNLWKEAGKPAGNENEFWRKAELIYNTFG